MAAGRTSDEAVDFLISYVRKDAAWAEWVAWQLEASGFRVHIRLWDLAPGSNRWHEANRVIQIARRTIAILSADYPTSDLTAPEWQAAWAADPTGQERRLLMLRVAETPAPGFLAAIVTVDLFHLDAATARSRLLAAATGERQKPSTEPHFPGGGGAPAEPAYPGPGGPEAGLAPPSAPPAAPDPPSAPAPPAARTPPAASASPEPGGGDGRHTAVRAAGVLVASAVPPLALVAGLALVALGSTTTGLAVIVGAALIVVTTVAPRLPRRRLLTPLLAGVIVVPGAFGIAGSAGVWAGKPDPDACIPTSDSPETSGSPATFGSRQLQVPAEDSAGPLSLVEVRAREGTNPHAERSCLTLEFLLNNVGEIPAYVKAVGIQVVRMWEIAVTCTGGAQGGGYQEITAQYQAVLDLDRGPGTVWVDGVSQVVNPAGTDRFTVSSIIEKRAGRGPSLLQLRVELVYNDDDATVRTEDFLVAAAGSITPRGFLKPEFGRAYQDNAGRAREADEATEIASPLARRYLDLFLGAREQPPCDL